MGVSYSVLDLSAPQPGHRLCWFPIPAPLWLWDDFLGAMSSHPPEEQEEVRESKEGDLKWGDPPAATPSSHPHVGPRVLSRQRGGGKLHDSWTEGAPPCPPDDAREWLVMEMTWGPYLRPLPSWQTAQGQAEVVWKNEGTVVCGS